MTVAGTVARFMLNLDLAPRSTRRPVRFPLSNAGAPPTWIIWRAAIGNNLVSPSVRRDRHHEPVASAYRHHARYLEQGGAVPLDRPIATGSGAGRDDSDDSTRQNCLEQMSDSGGFRSRAPHRHQSIATTLASFAHDAEGGNSSERHRPKQSSATSSSSAKLVNPMSMRVGSFAPRLAYRPVNFALT